MEQVQQYCRAYGLTNIRMEMVSKEYEANKKRDLSAETKQLENYAATLRPTPYEELPAENFCKLRDKFWDLLWWTPSSSLSLAAWTKDEQKVMDGIWQEYWTETMQDMTGPQRDFEAEEKWELEESKKPRQPTKGEEEYNNNQWARVQKEALSIQEMMNKKKKQGIDYFT